MPSGSTETWHGEEAKVNFSLLFEIDFPEAFTSGLIIVLSSLKIEVTAISEAPEQSK